MSISQIIINNALQNYNYILYDKQSRDAIIFDPLDFGQISKIVKEKDLKVRWLLNTHSHADHVMANDLVKNAYQLQLSINEDGKEIHLSDKIKLKWVHTPGHTMDHYCFEIYEKNIMSGLICGDTLFNAGVGNCKNGGDPETLFETTFDYIIKLPDRVKIYPSHNYWRKNLEFACTIEPTNEHVLKFLDISDLELATMISDIGIEKQLNPFLRCKSKSRFVELRKMRDSF
jgi:hydroxyacylglutathione hydrolase